MEAIRRRKSLVIFALLVGALLVWTLRRYEPKVTVSIFLSGLTLGALYFLVASGLSLIFGLMDVLNFAHGVVFMLGAYLGYTAYANPRLILNTLPLALVVLGAAQLGQVVARLPPVRAKTRWAPHALTAGIWLGIAALLYLGLRGVNLTDLAAGASTATGGAVSTAAAQEDTGVYLSRLAILCVAGLGLGLALASRQAGRPAVRPQYQPWLALGLIALTAATALLRTPAERLLLSLSSNWRFVLALAVGAAGGCGLGALIEVGLIRPLYSRPIYQVLMTLGLGFVGTELIKGVWGPAGSYMETPALFNSTADVCPSESLMAWFSQHCSAIDILGRPFPSYRMFIIALGAVIFLAVAVLLRRSRLGIIIRAGVQDSEMVQALGIDVRRVFTVVFSLGTGLAALGGVAAAPFLGVNLGLGQEVLFQGVISVVIGGMGSYTGAAVGALLVGLARAFGDQLVLSGLNFPWMSTALRLSPSIARASTVLIMALVLFLRPSGLFGRKE